LGAGEDTKAVPDSGDCFHRLRDGVYFVDFTAQMVRGQLLALAVNQQGFAFLVIATIPPAVELVEHIDHAVSQVSARIAQDIHLTIRECRASPARILQGLRERLGKLKASLP
jgi:hypothetical protein